MNSINNFINNAAGMTRNPLGIIALFISLIYGFACLVFGFGTRNLLYPSERLPLIWFIIVFPIVILLIFRHLVIKHHKKLYAPGDFQSDDGFHQADMSAEEMDRTNRLEVDYLSSTIVPDEDSKIEEKKKNQTKVVKEEVKEEAKEEVKIIEEEEEEEEERENEKATDSSSDFLKKTIAGLSIKARNSEIWAINEFSKDYNISVIQKQKIVKQGQSIEFDGIAKTTDIMYGIDVKYYIIGSTPGMEMHFQQNFRRLQEFWSALSIGRKFIPVFLFVLENKDEETEQEYKSFIKKYAPEAIVKVYDYKILQSKYSHKIR